MGALDGLKVLDLTRVLAGPYCTQMLGDLGATVWKIEPARGDETRGWGPPFDDQGMSAYFACANRSKKFVSVDIHSPEGSQLVQQLALRADVLIENFKVGDLARYGLDAASLLELNPRLVYASITGFGQTGPRAHQPGYDAVIQGMTGVADVTGEPDGEPMKVGVAWVDMMTGMHAAIGVLAALRHRDTTGEGQHLDFSLFETGIAAMANVGQSFLFNGLPPQRYGNRHPQIVPYGSFRARDAWIMVGVGNDDQFHRFAEVIGLEVLPAWTTNLGRVADRMTLEAAVATQLAGRPAADWVESLTQAKVPCGPIQSVGDALRDPQSAARGIGPELQTLPSPFAHLTKTPSRPSPTRGRIGEDTFEVLRQELGIEEADLIDLRTRGVIGQSA
jgi:crotonobetainyl-CoA:carnitine CoA-transferase CaiB-like acyl-CoA transferase